MTEFEKAVWYLNGVRAGEIPSPKWIIKAVERYDADLEKKDWEYFFDESEAQRILEMFSMFRFSKGDVAGKPFEIMPWFAALVYLAYGWRRKSGGRRFRKVYCKVPRGNAKTANLVNIATIGFLFDGQGDSEVYWLAMNKAQAKIGWDRQREMLRAMMVDFPELNDVLYLPKGNTSPRMTLQTGLSWVEYVGQDSPGRDGLNPYYIICDELHEWKNDDLMNKFESGMVKVADPVTWIITTAGYFPNGPNSQFLKACKNMLSGITEDDGLLAFVYEMDDQDDWRDREVWKKVNPGMGISLTMQGMETEFAKIASQGITKEIDFKVKNLNKESASESGWISDGDWVAHGGDIDWEDLKNRECWAGLDLANTGDFNAFVLFFPPVENIENSRPVIVPWFWIPEDAIEAKKRMRPFLWQWARDGFVKATSGNVTDYDIIRKDIREICAPLRLRSIAYDRALSSYLTPGLQEDGFEMIIYSQSWGNMAPPAQYFEIVAQTKKPKLIEDGQVDENISAAVLNVLRSSGNLPQLLHDGNPVARWMMSNIVMQYDRNQNHLPSKGASADKIDFISATLNAIGQWLIDRGVPKMGSYLFDDDAQAIVV